ncbi:MAG: hypothetical protein R3B54_15180 [Bdellovibrionota bacterium]
MTCTCSTRRGHGHETGLTFGVSYNEIRDALLVLQGGIIVFIMACHSGGLVNAFNAKKSLWENWGQYNPNPLVMASSKVSELSSTGPGTDTQEPGGRVGALAALLDTHFGKRSSVTRTVTKLG